MRTAEQTEYGPRASFPPNELQLTTPCLAIDAAALARNLRRAADFFTDRDVHLRPHFKAHKCTTLLRRQLDAGGCSGVTCATAGEALVLADAGFADILVANEVVGPHALASLARAARQAQVAVAVDSTVHTEMLEGVAVQEDVSFDVLIEIDVGLHRCGLTPGDPHLLSLADAIDRASRLTFGGLQGYEGHAVFVAERDKRRRLVEQAAEVLVAERQRLNEAGFDCALISGGGTGTYDLATEVGVLDEVQAGSYALMDARYRTLDLIFEPALFCVATVISRHGARAVVDAGLKSLSAEYGLPQPTMSGIEALALSDEHLQLAVTDGVNLEVGDRLALIPAHVDPTVNLHDTLFLVAGDEVEAWPIDGRRRAIAA